MPRRRPRAVLSAVCGALGVLLIFTALLIGYARRALFNERAFAVHVEASLEDPRVAGFVAEQITDALIEANPDLVGLRPVLIGLCRSVVISAPFRAAARRAARTMHHAILTGTARDVVLTVKDLGAVVESAVATQPGLQKKIPPGVSAAIGKLESLPEGQRVVAIVRFANRVRAAALGLLFLGIGLGWASVALATEKRRALLRLGLALTALGLLLGLVARFGGPVVSLAVRPPEMAPAIAGVIGAFFGGLMAWAAALGFAGLVLSSASASLLDRVPLVGWFDGAQRWLVGPRPRMRDRLLRGLLGVVVGAAILFWTVPSLTVLGWFLGLVVAFAGLREAFAAALHLLPQLEPRVRAADSGSRRAIPAGAIAVVAVLVVALLGGAAWFLFRSPAAPPEPRSIMAYNGLPVLGARRLDEVVFPTTHNSMSGADLERWMFPNQSAGMVAQLADGVRGFLIDVHYAVPVGDRVKTEIEDEVAAMAKYEAALGKEGLEAALRIRDRLVGEEKEKRDIYMCHGFCELGATPFVPVLREVRDFLVANPGEVLIFVIQDEGVTPQDIERCFQESGLIDFVYRGPVGPPWPTLQEMVTADERILVMTENATEGVAWIHPALEVLQETPYGFHDPSEFSNRPNRGGTSGSLYLMNHWIETTPMPKPSNAAIVNAHDVLLGRIRDFRKERGHLPNLVAVDFYREGDLIAVVRELNSDLPEPPRRGGRRTARTSAPAEPK